MASHKSSTLNESAQLQDEAFAPLETKVFTKSENKHSKGNGKTTSKSDTGREKSNPGPISAPLKLDPSNRPKPKALSTSATPYKNDPMWQDFEMEGFDGLTAYQPRCQFAITTEGLQGLIDRTYDTMNSADNHFSKHVSRSMFSYYIWQHAYARIIAIKAHTGEETHAEDRYLAFMRNETYPVPSVIEEYLRSLGTITDHTGVEFRLRFPAWPGRAGHFGRVPSDTHFLYESLAAPAVIAQRIVQDLQYTVDPQIPRTWNLPAALQPEEPNAGLPTNNLLGWAQAVTLSTEQRQLIEAAGVDVDSIHSDLLQFQLNRSLFESISDRLKRAELKIKLGSSVHESVHGSVAQTQWQSRDTDEEVDFDTHHQYSEGTVRMNSSNLEDKCLTVGALMCSFRVRKDTIRGLNPYCCYDFNNYTEVPAAWVNTRNNIYSYGQQARWNLDTFRSAFTNKDPMRTAWIRKIVKHPSRD